MNYYWFNRQEILQKAKERYSKEKVAEYYLIGYIKYFANGGKNMSFLIKDDKVREKYEETWN